MLLLGDPSLACLAFPGKEPRSHILRAKFATSGPGVTVVGGRGRGGGGRAGPAHLEGWVG